METHKKVIGNGVDWTNAINSITEENERHGVYYIAELDEQDLTAVRADIGVDAVRCEFYVELIAGKVEWEAPEGTDMVKEED